MLKSLKNIISQKLQLLAFGTMILLLMLALAFQVWSTWRQARENANSTFQQVGQVIRESSAELTSVKESYRETCLLNAETIAYIVQKNPDILGNVEEFRQLAHMMQVDEIHIFDQTGRIFTGTHPEYYDFTFDSGVQMQFFKPMMSDKSLQLCQDITPNTAEGKLVQYSALWSPDLKFIVQVGMYPDAVLEVTEKNELSYIFTLLQGNPGVSLYAIDAHSRMIVGSTSGQNTGSAMTTVGFDEGALEQYRKGTHATINGVNSFCVMEEMDGTLIAYVISNDQLYQGILTYTMLLALCLLVILYAYVLVIWQFINRYIISGISNINEKLRAVSDGKLDERVDRQDSLEFGELRQHINNMVGNILASTVKMSLVLNRTNMPIGVYEYNLEMKNVRFTDHIPKIFGLSSQELSLLSADYRELQKFLLKLRQNPLSDAENTYRWVGKTEKYLKLEEIVNGSDVLGIVMDVTEETLVLKRTKAERDIDLLTGLYNRRGMESELAALFANSETVQRGAILMIDSDGLKQVNDTYGHAVGDSYIRALADLLRNFGSASRLAARIGGDEFLLLLYGYADDTEVHTDIARLRQLDESTMISAGDGTLIPLRFSLGHVFTRGRQDYDAMIFEADGGMYRAKRLRKGEDARSSVTPPSNIPSHL